MAFVSQAKDGSVEGAVAYGTFLGFTNFHELRGNDTAAFVEDDVNSALVLAADYIDSHFSFLGMPVNVEQGTALPIKNPTEPQGIPFAEKAAYILALKKLNGKPLRPEVEFSDKVVAEETKKLGPLEKTIKYATSPTATSNLPGLVFPEIEEIFQASGILRTSSAVSSAGSLRLGRS